MTKNSSIKKHFLLFYTIKFYSRVKVIIFWPINVRIIYICFKLLGFYKSGERWKTRHSNVSNNPKAITILNFILLSYSHHASILTARMVILGKFCRVLHSLSRYSMLPTITTCFRSWQWKLLALSGITRLRRPIRGELASANRQTTTWLQRTVAEAFSLSYKSQKKQRTLKNATNDLNDSFTLC